MAKSVIGRINKALSKLGEKKLIPKGYSISSDTPEVDAITRYFEILKEEMVDDEEMPRNVFNFTDELRADQDAEKGKAAKSTGKVNTEVSVRQSTEVSTSMFDGDAGVGFENTDAQDYAVPIIRILQSNSHEVDPDDPKYVEGAKVGMFFNIATQEYWETITVIPCAYQKKDVEWVPRGEGGTGTFVAEYETSKLWPAPLEINDKGKRIIPSTKNELVRTAYFYVLLLLGNKVENAVIAMASTQLTASKKWMTTMGKIMFQGKNGQYPAPIYSHYYHLTTEAQSNAKGNWKGWKVTKGEILQDAAIYKEANAFFQLVKSGMVKADQATQNQDVDPNEPPKEGDDKDF